jgi:glycosyltransferase involved in cell wall biosynthesis
MTHEGLMEMIREENTPALRVLIVNDLMPDTGSIRWQNTLAGHWLAAGLEVTVFSLLGRPGIAMAAPPAGVAVLYGGGVAARLRYAARRGIPALLAAVGDTTVVVSSEVGWSMPLAYLFARLRGRSFVVMVQSVLEHSIRAWVPRWGRGLWRYCIRNADAVTAVSPGSADSVLRLGVPAGRVTVIAPGHDVDQVRRSARSSAARHVAGGGPVLVAVGELVEAKGYDVLLRAIAGVRARGFAARLVVLGEGPARRRLELLAGELGIADAVSLVGFVADPYPEMLAADLFCLSSRFEGFSLCLLEAMALGVPTVATDAAGGGPRALLDGGRLGDLVAPGSAEALERAIVGHLRRPEILRDRAAGGPEHARRFSPAASAEQYLGVFSRIARTPRAGRSSEHLGCD